jgi:tetraacyldisaccharide 4'-kinase
VLYNAAQPSTPWPGALARRSLAGAVPLADWWRGAAATLQALQALRDRPLIAAAGMAAPQRFFGMLRDAGLEFDALPLPDHHAFDRLPWPATLPGGAGDREGRGEAAAPAAAAHASGSWR